MTKKESRTDIFIVQIKFAFMGALKNLYLLENKLMEIANIPIYQYSNYLSQVALCIELGLKSIISNTDGFECIHDLDVLFNKTPAVFQKKWKSQWNDENIFSSNMSNMKNIFIDFRYMNFNSKLSEYLDKSAINDDGTINIQGVADLPTLQFLRLLLEEIKEYEKFIRDENVKQMKSIDCTNTDTTIAQYTKLLKDNQTNIVLSARSNP
jgi:hypothetical protein